MTWKKTFYGWMAQAADGRVCVIKKYRAVPRRGDGRWTWAYVVRVAGSAPTSPARAHETLAAARREAEQLAAR